MSAYFIRRKLWYQTALIQPSSIPQSPPNHTHIHIIPFTTPAPPFKNVKRRRKIIIIILVRWQNWKICSPVKILNNNNLAYVLLFPPPKPTIHGRTHQPTRSHSIAFKWYVYDLSFTFFFVGFVLFYIRKKYGKDVLMHAPNANGLGIRKTKE